MIFFDLWVSFASDAGLLVSHLTMYCSDFSSSQSAHYLVGYLGSVWFVKSGYV